MTVPTPLEASHDGRLVAILDLEFGYVGDPIGDIAIWRMRDT